jgi:protein-S-isoprenylcysteine O-methyltransferase Ste14
MKKRLKINGMIMVCIFLLIVIFPSKFFRHEKVVYFDEIAQVFGMAFILLGQIFRASGRGYKSEHSQDSRLLIQGGPYALVRNPMYLGILLIGLGIVLVLFNWWAMIIFLFIFITRYLFLIFKEEKKLKAAFPKDYPDYQKSVPRILPSMAIISQRDINEYLPLKLSWLKREIGSMLAVLLIVLFLGAWKDIKAEGLKAYLNGAVAIIITVILFISVIIYLIKKTGISK